MVLFHLNFLTKTDTMRKSSHLTIAFLLAIIFSNTVFSQVIKITGTVRNSSSSEVVSAVSVIVKGTTMGTYTSEQGTFELTVNKLPVTLIFSSIGYETQEVTVAKADQPVSVSFVPTSSLGQEVVVAPSR